MIHFASLKQIGEFRTSIDGEWSPMRADGHFLAMKPGFIWKSRFGSGFIPTKTAWLELLDGKFGLTVDVYKKETLEEKRDLLDQFFESKFVEFKHPELIHCLNDVWLPKGIVLNCCCNVVLHLPKYSQ